MKPFLMKSKLLLLFALLWSFEGFLFYYHLTTFSNERN